VKKQHIINIGYPKAGSSWLWTNLIKQRWFDQSGCDKENAWLINGKGIEEYINQYSQFNYSANFNPAMFAIDRYLIEQLPDIATVRATIIIRDPVDMLWSLYNFTNSSGDFNSAVPIMMEHGNHPGLIVRRWKEFFKDRFATFLYDELSDTDFINRYSTHFDLPAPIKVDKTPINVTLYKSRRPKLSKDNKQFFYTMISELEQELNISLTQWIQKL